jgi:hypothetical protein
MGMDVDECDQAQIDVTGRGLMGPGADFRRERVRLGADWRRGRVEPSADSSRARGYGRERKANLAQPLRSRHVSGRGRVRHRARA